MPNGGAVANITLATSESWRDKQTGENKEITEWHRVVFFGKLAEIVGEHLRKGSQVYIEGQLKTRKWQDQQGVDRYTTEVVVNVGGTMQMLGGAKKEGGSTGANSNSGGWGKPQQPMHPGTPGNNGGTPRNPNTNRPQNNSPANGNEPPMDFDDDIPF